MPKRAWPFPAGNALLERRTNTGWPKAIACQPCRPNNKLTLRILRSNKISRRNNLKHLNIVGMAQLNMADILRLMEA